VFVFTPFCSFSHAKRTADVSLPQMELVMALDLADQDDEADLEAAAWDAPTAVARASLASDTDSDTPIPTPGARRNRNFVVDDSEDDESPPAAADLPDTPDAHNPYPSEPTPVATVDRRRTAARELLRKSMVLLSPTALYSAEKEWTTPATDTEPSGDEFHDAASEFEDDVGSLAPRPSMLPSPQVPAAVCGSPAARDDEHAPAMAVCEAHALVMIPVGIQRRHAATALRCSRCRCYMTAAERAEFQERLDADQPNEYARFVYFFV
jgi:hypothetical protein